jgi:hypothetical protein
MKCSDILDTSIINSIIYFSHFLKAKGVKRNMPATPYSILPFFTTFVVATAQHYAAQEISNAIFR